jgi:hypothetical protein
MVTVGRWLLRTVLRLAYAVRITGLEHYDEARPARSDRRESHVVPRSPRCSRRFCPTA